FSCPFGKPPRPRHQQMLRDILLIARPPLLAVMQGGEYARFQLLLRLLLSAGPGSRLRKPAVFHRNVLLDRFHLDGLITERARDDPGEWDRGALHIAEIGVINSHDVLSHHVWQEVNEAQEITAFRIEEKPDRHAAKCQSTKLV